MITLNQTHTHGVEVQAGTEEQWWQPPRLLMHPSCPLLASPRYCPWCVKKECDEERGERGQKRTRDIFKV